MHGASDVGGANCKGCGDEKGNKPGLGEPTPGDSKFTVNQVGRPGNGDHKRLNIGFKHGTSR